MSVCARGMFVHQFLTSLGHDSFLILCISICILGTMLCLKSDFDFIRWSSVAGYSLTVLVFSISAVTNWKILFFAVG